MEELYIENSITKALDQVLEAARSGEYDFAPWIPLIGLPGMGKTSSVNAWLQHHHLKYVYIDAPALVLHSAETAVLPMEELKDFGVRLVGNREMEKLMTPEKRNVNLIFPEDLIDEVDGNTAVVIDNYDKADDEVRKELMNFIAYHQVTDLRAETSDKTETINPLMMVVIIDEANVMIKNHLSENEVRLFGLEDLF